MTFRQAGQGFLSISHSSAGRFDVFSWAMTLVLIGVPTSLVAAVFMAWLVAGSRWAGNRPAAVATWVSGWASTAALLLVVGFRLMIKSYGR
jgi:hypothetical protein